MISVGKGEDWLPGASMTRDKEREGVCACVCVCCRGRRLGVADDKSCVVP